MSPWRAQLYQALKKVSVEGRALDIGGSKTSGYHEIFPKLSTIEVNNIDITQDAEYRFDLEKKFPVTSSTYDVVLAINVLEHIYAYQNVLGECSRVLRSGGNLVLAVPFLMFVHPSPHDYWRYTKETLTRLVEDAGYQSCDVYTIASGPGAVFEQMLGGARGGVFLRRVTHPFLRFIDFCLGLFLSREVLSERFPLGYVVVAKNK